MRERKRLITAVKREKYINFEGGSRLQNVCFVLWVQRPTLDHLSTCMTYFLYLTQMFK